MVLNKIGRWTRESLGINLGEEIADSVIQANRWIIAGSAAYIVYQLFIVDPAVWFEGLTVLLLLILATIWDMLVKTTVITVLEYTNRPDVRTVGT